MLDRLSVFVGGFDLQAAEAVCGADPLASDDVIDLLSSLVEKSLVMVEDDNGASRYGLLETSANSPASTWANATVCSEQSRSLRRND